MKTAQVQVERRHSRIPVHLDAVLIGEKTVPKGCKVRNISRQGMQLQCVADGRMMTFEDGDNVDIHLLFQRTDGWKYLTVAATVRHVDTHGVGVELDYPDPQLQELLGAYRPGQNRPLEAAITPEYDTLPEYDTTPKENIPAGPQDSVDTLADDSVEMTRTLVDPPVVENNQRLFYLGMASLIIAVCILVASFAYISGFSNRLSTLESVTGSYNSEFAAMRSRIADVSELGESLTFLNTRMQALTRSIGTLEGQLTSIASQPATSLPAATPVQSAVAAPTSPLPVTGTAVQAGAGTEQPGAAAARETAATKTPEVATATVAGERPNREGPWVINLISSPNRTAVERFAKRAQRHDIPVEQNSVQVKGKEYWRIQVSGFTSAADAESYAGTIKEKLGLPDVWIFKRQGPS